MGFYPTFQKIITFFNDTFLNRFKVLLCVEKYALFYKNTFPDIQFQKPQNISKKPKIFEFFENSQKHPLTSNFHRYSIYLKISNFLLYFLKVISFKKQNRTQCYGPPNIPEFLTTGVPLWKKSKVQNFRILTQKHVLWYSKTR